VPELDLRVGSLVVYRGYGLGRVSEAPTGKAGASPGVVLEFDGGLSVTLPHDRAVECLRAVSDEDELARVRDALRSRDAAAETTWQNRTRATQTKIAAGEAVGLAEVVRDSMVRLRASSNGALSVHERELYLKARHLLAAELAAATATDEAQAEAWIDGQLEASAAE
jgi:RNA polymerase-interacting CarD/CdnL/TRCF family regulator